MNLYSLEKDVPKSVLKDFLDYINGMEWYRNNPGGFLTNSPQRYVNTFGDGAEVDDKGNIITKGWPITFWTAKVNQNNVSLGSIPETLPSSFARLIPYLRKLFVKEHGDNANITYNTFNIAVCNYYTEPQDNIAAHTDDNAWYPKELKDNGEQRPVFASITLYPQTKPKDSKSIANFEIYTENEKGITKWQKIDLIDKSILIMPSDIKHRVKAIKADKFHPRINITFRSTYSVDINPLMNAIAVANHTRYYKIPSGIYYPDSINIENLDTIIDVYNNFNRDNNEPEPSLFKIKNKSYLKNTLKKEYDLLCQTNGYNKVKYSANIVAELIAMVLIELEGC